MGRTAKVGAGLLLAIGMVLVMLFGPTITGHEKAAAYSVTRVSFSVKTSSYNTNVRSGPGTGYSTVRKIAPNTTLACDGWTYGTRVTDIWLGTPDYRWYKLRGLSQWVASGVVKGNAPGSSPVPPKTTAPSTRVSRAISWARSMVGRSSFPLVGGGSCPSYMWCAKFVANAYGSRSAGFESAQKLYNWEKANGRLRTSGTPQLGALCFYSYSSYGHVALYIGNGQVIGAGGSVIRVDRYTSALGRPYLGWAMPPSSWPGR